MKTISLYLAYIMCFTILLGACGNNRNGQKKDSVSQANKENKVKLPDSSFKADASFAVAAAEAHIMHSKTAELCETNASLDTVVKFGRMLVNKHTLINKQLTGWAKSNNVSLPDSLTAENKNIYKDLAKERDRNFEKNFTHFIISNYQLLLDNYRKEAESGKDTLLKAWTREKIRILETDLQTAHWIEAVLTKSPLKNKS